MASSFYMVLSVLADYRHIYVKGAYIYREYVFAAAAVAVAASGHKNER